MLRNIILSLFIPLVTFAQSDEKAISTLKQVSTTTQAYKDIDIRFTFTLENESAKMKDVRDGHLTLMGTKFRVELMGQDIYSDGKIVWYDMKEDKEVHVKTMEEFKEETDLDPSEIFTQYEKGYKAKFVGTETIAGKPLTIIDLFPEIPGKKPYSRVRLGIDKSNHIVYSKTFGKDGTNYVLEVKEMKTNAGVSSAQFAFNKDKFVKAGYDVEDFR